MDAQSHGIDVRGPESLALLSVKLQTQIQVKRFCINLKETVSNTRFESITKKAIGKQ